MDIITIETSSLGDRSYVVVAGSLAAVIDPQRDIDRIEAVVAEHRATLTHVFETHVHNDYVTGGVELSARAGAVYVIASGESLGFEHHEVHDGQRFDIGRSELGEVQLRAAHTPGHTHDHMAYVLEEAGSPVAVFTGGSLLFGSVGRTDLISEEATEALTRAQFRSVRGLVSTLPAEVQVHPTHGFGSFCSSSSTSGVDASVIGDEARQNLALQLEEDEFVEQLLAGLTEYPAYYTNMGPINRSGPAPVDLSEPEMVNPVELRRRIHRGEWVVDLRARVAFAREHLRGTLNLEVGDSFITYLGWIMPWNTPVTLVGESRVAVAEAQRQMVRIGIDRPAGASTERPRDWAEGERSSFPTARFEDLAAASPSSTRTVLDVRRTDEWDAGHLADAINIPLQQLEDRLDEVPDGELWVHCVSGYRAALGASILARAGRSVVLIDDDWAHACESTGLRCVSPV